MGRSTPASPHSYGFAMGPQDHNAMSFPRSAGQGMREGVASFCLGHPPHPVRAEEVICHICGTLVSGALLGIYQVQQLLGSGRSGKTYLAMHIRSRQSVALKLFSPDPASDKLWDAARREVRVITSLRHNAILPVFSCTTWQTGTHPGSTKPLHELMTAYPEQEYYLLTLCQYAPARLSHLVSHYERHKATSHDQGISLLPRLVHLIQQIGAALSLAHSRGIVHGALVPGNILANGREQIWLADFGLARLHPPAPPYLAPELQKVCQISIQQGNLAPFWNAAEPANDQYMLSILSQQIFARLLHPSEYEHLIPILQCAAHPQPARRFAHIDVFIHELVTQTHGRRSHTVKALAAPQRRGNSGIYQGGAEKKISDIHQQILSAPASRTPDIRRQGLEPEHGYIGSGSSPNAPASSEEWEALGGKFFTGRDYDAAAKAYRRALELDGRKPSLWLALGDTYFALESYPEALKAYEQAMVLNPNDPLAWSNRGTALDALGRHKEAAECYERAEQLSSSLPEAL